ncbi:MAG: hypothetical protein HN842_02495, partial [Gammaproteobacteria bacterium]|nr:hypothetical protein [Gammaproteobacteria bacterium]
VDEHPILELTRAIHGTSDCPIELFMGGTFSSPVVKTTAPMKPANPKPLPRFRPRGRRRDPATANITPEQTSEDRPPGSFDPSTILDPLYDKERSNTFGTNARGLRLSTSNANGNGNSAIYLQEIARYTATNQLHCIALLDTRIGYTASAIKAHKDHLRRVFGSKIHAIVIPSRPAPGTKNPGQLHCTGGITIIKLSSEVSIQREFSDPSRFGCFHTLRLRYCGQSLDWTPLYLPTEKSGLPSPSSDALWDKVQIYLNSKNLGSVTNWITSILLKRGRGNGSVCGDTHHSLIMGDFNMDFSLHTDEPPTATALRTAGFTTSWHSQMTKRGLCNLTFFRNDEIMTAIDTGYTTLPSKHIASGGSGDPDIWCIPHCSDHVPIWIGLDLAPLSATGPTVESEHQRCHPAIRLDPQDTKTIAAIQADCSLLRLQPDTDNPYLAESILEELSRKCVAIAQWHLKKHPRPAFSKGQGYEHLWSTESMAMKRNRAALLQAQRCLRSRQLQTRQISSAIRRIRKWGKTTQIADSKYRSPEQWILILESLLQEPNSQIAARQNLIIQELDTEAKALLNNNSAAGRKKISKDVACKVTKRENCRKENKLKSVIQSLTNNVSITYNFSSLVLDTGETVTCPARIHQLITAHFERAFANPEDALPTIAGLESPDLGSTHIWESLLEHPDKFVEIFANTQVPKAVILQIAQAFATTADPRITAEIEAAMEPAFTFQEFLLCLRRKRGNSAGGLSGLTYGLLKILPPSVQQHLFDSMNTLWKANIIPDFWKLKSLQLLIKDVTKEGLGNLRPIGLIEVTRKIWTSMILDRIRPIIFINHVLQTNQYGFTPKHGVQDELIQLINLIESCRENDDTPLTVSTWDIRKAFDSVGRNLQYAIWRRMGIPEPIAKWFCRLDDGGIFVVRSPHASETLLRIPADNPLTDHHRTCREVGLLAQRGLTQGDVLSTLGWTGFFDILITTLNNDTTPGRPLFFLPGSKVADQRSAAYADDLITPCCTPERLQRDAIIISGFMALTGLNLAIDKIRCFSNWANPGDVTHYSWQWEKRTVPVGNATAVVKILGIHFTVDGDWDPLYDFLLQQAQDIARAMGPKLASLSTKAVVLALSSVGKILYRTQFASLSPDQLDNISAALLTIVRDYKTIGRSFPTKVILSPELGKIFPDIKLATRKLKTQLKGRCSRDLGSGDTKRSMESLLTRVSRWHYFDGTIDGGSSRTRPHPAYNWWANDIAQGMEDNTTETST